MALQENEVKAFVSAPDEKTNLVTISVILGEKRYTTSIANIENQTIMKRAIKSMISSLVRYQFGLKRRDACVVVEENKAIKRKKTNYPKEPKEGVTWGRPRTKPITPATEAKKEYDHRRHLALKELKANA